MTDPVHQRPRVGVPWRTSAEESANKRRAYDAYLAAVTAGGGDPVEISLSLTPTALAEIADTLDAFVLPGSPADVDPARYGSVPHSLTAAPDRNRELIDDALIEHVFATGKPLLAICYGTQLLNVHLGGTLFQDIPSELHTEIAHDHKDGAPDSSHAIQIAPDGGTIADLALESETQLRAAENADDNHNAAARVNSSHHQSIRELGRGLKVTARAPDGIVEAVEWVGTRDEKSRAKPQWLVGVQWHPERMPGDTLADNLFRELISVAQHSKG